MAKYISISTILICLLVVINSAWSDSRRPLEVIQASNSKILAIYKNSKKVDQDVQKKIFAVMEKVTDFNSIGERAIDGFCVSSAPETCIEFKKVFIELLKMNATRKLGRSRADSFDYSDEKIDGNRAVISTTAHYQGDSIQLNYILERKPEGWLVTNYIADGVDTIKNYRRQFSRIIRKNSLEYLIKRLKTRIEEYRAEIPPTKNK